MEAPGATKPPDEEAHEDRGPHAKSPSPPPLPLVEQFESARRAARFFARHWHTRRDGRAGTILLPGLETISSPRLSRSTGEQIASLLAAAASAHEDYVRTLSHADADLVTEAHRSLWELRSVLEWIADELPSNQDRDELDAFLQKQWYVDDTPDALVRALAAHVSMVRAYLPHGARVVNFDTRELDRASQLENTLAQLARDGVGAKPESRRALATRDRLLALLHERVRRVRAAARFVFRHHPEIRAELGV